MSATGFIPKLSGDEQVALLAMMLALMNADLQTTDEEDRKLREAVRGLLRLKRRDAAPDGLSALDPVPLEEPETRRAVLGQVSEARISLLLIVEAAIYEPWATLERSSGRLAAKPRRAVLDGFLRELGGDLTAHHLLEVDRHIRPKPWKRPRRRPGAKQIAVLAGGLAAGYATAGIAAPAIGTAIGGVMGLSGAAATSAGLALLGGGSLASGGAGAVGGTALLAALGGAGGGGLAGLLAQGMNREQVQAEKAKLAALLHTARLDKGSELEALASSIEAALERELGRLIGLRADALAAGDTEKALNWTKEIEAVLDLRRTSSPFPFDLQIA